MVLDPIPQSLPVHFFGSRPQPPTSRYTLRHTAPHRNSQQHPATQVQHSATHDSAAHCSTIPRNTLNRHVTQHCNTTATPLQHNCNTTATHDSTAHCNTILRNTLNRHVTQHCNTTATQLQHNCNTRLYSTLQHNTAQHSKSTRNTTLQHNCNTTATPNTTGGKFKFHGRPL